MDTLFPLVIGLRVLRAVSATKRIRGVLQSLQTQLLMYVPVAGCEGANADHNGAAVKIGPVWHTHRACE